jgi:hypothetical protein
LQVLASFSEGFASESSFRFGCVGVSSLKYLAIYHLRIGPSITGFIHLCIVVCKENNPLPVILVFSSISSEFSERKVVILIVDKMLLMSLCRADLAIGRDAYWFSLIPTCLINYAGVVL